ncbi:hypothetical protein ABZ608_14115 [Streptomyces sp. NPDC013172]
MTRSVALIVLANAESHADLGRVVNALVTAKEFKEGGDESGSSRATA